jgi:hypothetical protein
VKRMQLLSYRVTTSMEMVVIWNHGNPILSLIWCEPTSKLQPLLIFFKLLQ